MDWRAGLDLPGKILEILALTGSVADISPVSGSGVFHAGKAWKVTISGLPSFVLLKRRPFTELAKSQAILGFSLLVSDAFRGCNWVPQPLPRFGAFQEFAGAIYQAWEWVPGASFGESPFPLKTALERLTGTHRNSRASFGEKVGPVPGIRARLEALALPVPADVLVDPVSQKAKEVVDRWTPLAVSLLEKARVDGRLIVCHGDCWVGNWLQAESSFEKKIPVQYSYPFLIDWSNVRWDHPAVDEARLIGSVGEAILPGPGNSSESLATLLAWTGHLAALRRWLIRLKDRPWNAWERARVAWVLTRLGETTG